MLWFTLLSVGWYQNQNQGKLLHCLGRVTLWVRVKHPGLHHLSLTGFLTRFFLSVIWLTHGQLKAIVKGHPHSPDINHCVIQILNQRSPGAS